MAIALAALAIFVAFSLRAPSFLSATVMIDLAGRSAILGILAVGMTFLFIAGEFDLSIGSHYGFLLILLAKLSENARLDPWVASFIVLAVGTAIGILILLRGATQTLSSGYPVPRRTPACCSFRLSAPISSGRPCRTCSS